MEIQENFVNKVAQSGLITLDPSSFYPKGDRLVYDIKDGLQFLKEKFQDNLPSLISFATGPSRTADIAAAPGAAEGWLGVSFVSGGDRRHTCAALARTANAGVAS